MYFDKKEKQIEQQKRIIKKQQSIIDELSEENEYLKEQLKTYTYENLKTSIDLANNAYSKYLELIESLEICKREYEKLNYEIIKKIR